MLALRNSTRFRPQPNPISLSTRYGRLLQSRLYHPAIHPYTWKAWFFYRRDGTQRSKLTGAILASAMVTTLYILHTSMELLEKCLDATDILQALVLLQRLDVEYSSYDFNKPADAMAYITILLRSFPTLPKEHIEGMIEVTDQLVNSKKESHLALQQCLEELHQVLGDGRLQAQPPLETAKQALYTLFGGLKKVYETGDENDKQVGSWIKIRTSSGKDSSYDVLG